MYSKKPISKMILLAGVIATSQAIAAPSPRNLEQSLVGCWAGELQYRDYQSNRVFELPVKTVIERIGDGHTFVRKSSFMDGHKKTVYITSLTQFSEAGDNVQSVGSRINNPMEVSSDSVTVRSYSDDGNWQEEYQRTDIDGSERSNIKTIVTLNADALTAERLVKKDGLPDTSYVFRNKTVLHKDNDCQH